MKLTPKQIEAALVLAGLQQDELAKLTGLTQQGISLIITGKVEGRSGTLQKIKHALEMKGIEFLENQGLRIRSGDIEVFEGIDRFNEFSDFVYEYLKDFGGDVCISVTNERLFQKYRKNQELHRKRMKELVETGKVTGRVLAAETEGKEVWAKIRRLPPTQASPVSFYAFGNCFALISFDHEPAPYVVLHKSGPFAEAFRQSFNLAWENAKAE